MNYNKNKNKLNPKRINNYNKFLATLDKKSRISLHSYLNGFSKLELKNNNINNEYKENIKSTKNDINLNKDDIVINLEKQMEIEKFMDKINLNFKIGDFSSSSFTGQWYNDKYSSNNIDPNYYREIAIKNKIIYKENNNFSNDIEKKCFDNTELSPKFKENINIELEINNIQDLLDLLKKYPYDPNIKYNINMKVLNDIKEPLEDLNNMIGMNDLKINIVDQILYFIQELHKNNSIHGDFLHTVIYGPPGTGKTEVAKIMGNIYSKIGILSKGTFKKVGRSDLIAGYLGQTALKTREVIKDSIGGVLFIDEAYSLGNVEKKDSFAKECIDTLCEALSDNKENWMVIIAGYEKELKECFFNYNQGLESRFTWRFKTEEYSSENLYEIFVKKVKDYGWEMDENSKISSEWFNKNKDYIKFYGRDIETILAKTKIAHSRRIFGKSENEKRKINLKDLDKGFEIYLKNNDAKNIKEKLEMDKYLYNTLYS